MIRILQCLSLCMILMISFCALAEQSAGYDKDPRAIALLEKAAEAIRNLRGIEYRAQYLGTYTSRGRMNAEVLLRRESGADEVMGTIAYSAKFEIRATDAPFGQEHLPASYTLIETSGQTMLIHPATRTIRKALGQDRMGLNYGSLTNGMLPQYLRPAPFKFEIEDSRAAQYLGTTEVEGVESHIVWLKFDEVESGGFGEQLLYLGVDDHLIRKATLVAQKAVLPRRERDPENAPVRTYPTMHIEVTLSDLKILSEVPDSAFEFAMDDFRLLVASDRPGVGAVGPEWSLPKPDGGTVRSGDLRGKFSLLFFWASWCPICHTYFAEIQRIHDNYADQVRVLAINAFDRDDAMAYIREHGYTFDVALDGDDLLANEFGFIGQPALVLLDPDGVIRYLKLGAGDEELLQQLEELTAKTK